MRKEIDITITDDGRDLGKVFHIKEMSASQAEKWAMRALMIAARSGVDVGEALGAGMKGIAILGVTSLMTMNFFEAEPLLDEMMTCVRIKPDPKNRHVIRDLIDDDIEEILTRIKLRREVLNLHVDFSTAGALLKSTSETTVPAQPSSTTPTSQAPSVQFSRRAKSR